MKRSESHCWHHVPLTSKSGRAFHARLCCRCGTKQDPIAVEPSIPKGHGAFFPFLFNDSGTKVRYVFVDDDEPCEGKGHTKHL